MKLAVCIASRNRALELASVVMSLKRLSSERHELSFHIGIDEDDHSGDEIFYKLIERVPISFHAGPRPPALGMIHNQLASFARDADAMCILADNMVPITMGWDEHIAQGVARYPDRILWWSSPINPGNVAPVVPKAWLKAMDYRVTPEIFPFWFDDTWLEELDLMIFGPPALRLGCQFAGNRGHTTRGREFRFWFETFSALRFRRIEQAERIAESLGVPWRDNPALIQQLEHRDNAMLQSCPRFEERFGDRSAPGEGYLQAKERAKSLL